MKYKSILVIVFVLLVALFSVLSCSQNPVINEEVIDVDITNQSYITNYATNVYYVYVTNYTTNTNQVYITTNTNYITNTHNQTVYVYGLSSNVSFSLVDVGEGAIVQPYYRFEGVLLEGFTYNDVDKFFIYITNNGFSNNFEFSTFSNFTGIISASGYSSVYAYITLFSKLNSSYTLGLNLKISNIPIVKILSIQEDFVITFGNTNIDGYIDISTPDNINSVFVIVSNSSGISTNIPTTNEGSSWTNVVKRVMFYSLPNLIGGYNYIRVIAVSSSGVVGVSRTITILKSLFTIDGLYENAWNNSKLVATATSVNPYFGWGIGSMRVTNDDFFLYIFVSNLNVPNLGDNGLKLSISIDTNSPSGLSNDAWVGANQRGRFVYSPTNGNYPDIQIHIRLKQTNQINGAGVYVAVVGSTNYWSNVANTWTPGMDRGVMFGVNNSVGWEVAIPLSLINIQSGSTLRFIAVLGKPDGDEKNSAIHILPASPLNEITTNDGFFTNIIRVWSDMYNIY